MGGRHRGAPSSSRASRDRCARTTSSPGSNRRHTVLVEQEPRQVVAKALTRQPAGQRVAGHLPVRGVGRLQGLRHEQLHGGPLDHLPLLSRLLGEPGGRGDEEPPLLGDAIAQAGRPQDVGQRVAGRDAGRDSAPSSGSGRSRPWPASGRPARSPAEPDRMIMPEHLAPGACLTATTTGRFSTWSTRARMSARASAGKGGTSSFSFSFSSLSPSPSPPRPGRRPSPSPRPSWPSPSDRLGRRLLRLGFVLLLGDRRGKLVEPADAESAFRRRDHGDVAEPAVGEVLQRVVIGSAPDLDRDRDRELDVIGDEPLEVRLVLQEQGRLAGAQLLEPVALGDVALGDAGRRRGTQVRAEPLNPAAPLGARRPVRAGACPSSCVGQHRRRGTPGRRTATTEIGATGNLPACSLSSSFGPARADRRRASRSRYTRAALIIV